MATSNNRKVLLTDGRTLSCLAFARALGRKGLEVHVGESFKHNITAFSKFTNVSHIYPPAEKQPEQFRTEILGIIRQSEFDFVIPIRDKTTKVIAEIRDQLPSSTNVLLDSADKIESLDDKERCSKLAERVGVPIPTTYYPSEMSISEISEIAAFPALVKPTDSSGARGIQRVERPAELKDVYADVKREAGNAIIQEYVDQSGGHYSIGTVFDRKSKPVAIHVYKELLQYPDSGGPAIRAVSVRPEPWVENMLEILQSVDWIGPAHMDVLFDPVDNTFKLLEINPRIWMSVNLSIKSGVDIPQIILETARGDTYRSNQKYQTDVYYRWVLPNEILWTLSGNYRTRQQNGRAVLRDSPVCYGVLSRDDPRAIGGVVAQSIGFLLDGEKRRMIFDRGW